MDKNFYSRLTEILPEDRIKEEEPMRLHTTFRVGGPVLCDAKDGGGTAGDHRLLP